MSSGFVSGGSLDKPAERDDAWRRAEEELAAKRKQKEAENRHQDPSKSLFEVLQANKAAKQEAFEEASRLKNQFRALDEDEVEYLEEITKIERENEAKKRREEAEGLDVFRKQRAIADRAALEAEKLAAKQVPVVEDSWNSRKRKKGEGKPTLPGVKIRKTSSSIGSVTIAKKGTATTFEEKSLADTIAPSPATKAAPTASSSNPKHSSGQAAILGAPSKAGFASPVGLGLDAYSSDEEG